MREIFILRFKSAVLFFGVIFVLVFSGCTGFSSRTLDMVGKPAPYTRLLLLDGSYVPLVQYHGKLLVLVFWETQCPYSRPVVEKLNEYGKANADRSDVVLIAVSIDPYERQLALEEMIREKNLNHILHAFSGNDVGDEAFFAFSLDAIPSVIVIGRDGTVKEVSRDAEVIEKYLGEEQGDS